MAIFAIVLYSFEYEKTGFIYNLFNFINNNYL